MSTPILTVRALTQLDADAFKALRLEAIDDAPTAVWPTREEEQAKTSDFVRAQLTQSDRQIVMGAFDDDALVGIAGLRRESLKQVEHKALLWGVFVRPLFRRTGIARRMLDALFDQARAQGVLQIALCVNTHNLRARQLYVSLGFVSYGIEPRAMCVDGRYFDEEHMLLRLDHA